MQLVYPFRFFTNWSLLFHFLFLLGIVKNTFTLALFVVLGSIVITKVHCQEESYDWITDLGLHYAPLLVFLFTGIDWSWETFWMCWVCYISYTWGDVEQILTWYTYPSYFFFHENEDEMPAPQPACRFGIRSCEDVMRVLYLGESIETTR